MRRVPASVAVVALRQSGYRVSTATLRQWRRRGHLTKRNGYDLAEILAYIDSRERRHPRPDCDEQISEAA